MQESTVKLREKKKFVTFSGTVDTSHNLTNPTDLRPQNYLNSRTPGVQLAATFKVTIIMSNKKHI